MATTGEFFATVRRLAHRAGIELRLFSPLRDDPELRVATICRESRVDLLVDVGASYGLWAGEVRRTGYEGDIISFEPHPEVYCELAMRAGDDNLWRVEQCAIGPDAGMFELKVAGGTEWSSLLPAADRDFEPTRAVATTQVPVDRLDAILKDDPHRRLFLKLDVQGYELKALRSAEGIVDRIVAGKAEVLLDEVYDGQPALIDFLVALAELDLKVTGFENGYIKPDGRERFVDVMFGR